MWNYTHLTIIKDQIKVTTISVSILSKECHIKSCHGREIMLIINIMQSD
jgi:hypothetical protein